jgi:hypothetical protein
MFHVKLGKPGGSEMFHVEQHELSSMLQCSIDSSHATIAPRFCRGDVQGPTF